MNALRKRTDGYALLYVLLVVLVLCAVSMGICTVVLRSYQGQVRSVEQTRQLYQAEGEVEKFAALAADVSGLEGETPLKSSGQPRRPRQRSAGTRTGALGESDRAGQRAGSHLPGVNGEPEPPKATFTLTYRNEDVEVRAQVRWPYYQNETRDPSQEDQGHSIMHPNRSGSCLSGL